jgi:ATP-dependent Clp protease ATP-binding subunit ClpA
MISHDLEVLINLAIKRSNRLCHEFLSLESLLLDLLKDSEIRSIIGSCKVDIELIEGELSSFLEDDANFRILDDEEIEKLSQQQFSDENIRAAAASEGIRYNPETTQSFQRVLQRAAMHVQSSGKREIRAVNVLVAMMEERNSFALYTMELHGLDRFSLVREIAHGVDRPETESGEEIEGEKPRKDGSSSSIARFTRNLNQLAHEGKIDPIIGRADELKALTQIFCRRQKNNPLIVGESGVGKTALVDGLAWSIVHGKAPKILENYVIYALDMALVLAGAKYRGEFEERLHRLIVELEERADRGEGVVLFIDDLHTIMGAGAVNGGSMDASGLLKSALNSGKIRCLGITTHAEYRKFIERDSAFARRFRKVELPGPTSAETLKILQGVSPHFEQHHQVKYSLSVMKQIIQLADKYLADRHFPDKAIDIMDEVGASLRIEGDSKRKKVTSRDIERVISSEARVPRESVATEERDRLKNLEKNIKLLIFGQNEAISTVSDAVLVSRAGIGGDERPWANFLFTGPTGVGKTELARQLAINLGIHFVRFDMSEYMEKHAIAKLIGAPPGYIGHDQGGILTDAIKQHPHAVLLLDEIEKAHQDIFNILLQVMDHGVLTDSQGRKSDFRNTILIMTTNAGAREMDGGRISLGENGAIGDMGRRDKVIRNFFSPEFRNRLDAIINFNTLSKEFILQIVDKFLYQLELKLVEKRVSIKVDFAVKEWLSEEGYDPKMGARPLIRVIEDKISKPLSREILFGKLVNGGDVKVVLLKGDKIGFQF